ncbi:MAG: short-chain dehydrogenase/reductase [Frankiales bacterium]|jgi:NAD(P)-dependent dehydrogenase (short-subunit alcohol dehydrogenase family)|nr:short-chain dehydrogenase/reductase [Frankiales bacterium]
MTSWTSADVPDQTGRTALVTGANSGLGLHTSLELARRGARVLMACRDPRRGAEALARVRAVGTAELVPLDLASLASVRAAAEQVDPLDLLIANAGVMAVPRRLTEDGFELQLGTNHLGHFALTGLLLPKLTGRVVVVSSDAHRMGRMRFDDLMGERSYGRWSAYGQSKLANLLFARELGRRAPSLVVAAAHPGYAATNLQRGQGNPLLVGLMQAATASSRSRTRTARGRSCTPRRSRTCGPAISSDRAGACAGRRCGPRRRSRRGTRRRRGGCGTSASS